MVVVVPVVVDFVVLVVVGRSGSSVESMTDVSVSSVVDIVVETETSVVGSVVVTAVVVVVVVVGLSSKTAGGAAKKPPVKNMAPMTITTPIITGM